MNDEIKFEVPSLASSAMLVELQISTWTARKKDKRASTKVTDNNNAERGTATVNKKLLGKCNELDAIQKFAANARVTHYGMTMPWSDLGQRLLTTEMYFDYHKVMTELQQEYEGLCNYFISNYSFEIAQAHSRLGNLFNHNDYPSPESIIDKFRFKIAYLPLPEFGDFRVDVGKEGTQLLQDHYREYYTSQVEVAMGDLWKRLYTCLDNMSERLREPTHEEQNSKRKVTKTGSLVFRDSLVENMIGMFDMLKTCNVTGDSQMEAMRMRLDNVLHGITPDALREDSLLRAETKKAVDKAIADLPSLDL